MRYLIASALILLIPSMCFAGTVSLNWNPPILSCDGSTLSDLSGYVVLWGTSSGGPYPNQHHVDDPGAQSTVVNVGSVENQTLYFVSISVDSSGNRSDDVGGCGTSNEIAVSFGALPPSPPTGLAAQVNN